MTPQPTLLPWGDGLPGFPRARLPPRLFCILSLFTPFRVTNLSRRDVHRWFARSPFMCASLHLLPVMQGPWRFGLRLGVVCFFSDNVFSRNLLCSLFFVVWEEGETPRGVAFSDPYLFRRFSPLAPLFSSFQRTEITVSLPTPTLTVFTLTACPRFFLRFQQAVEESGPEASFCSSWSSTVLPLCSLTFC